MDTEDLGLRTALANVTSGIKTPAKGGCEPDDDRTANGDPQGWLNWVRLSEKIGVRYLDCRIKNFVLSSEPKDRERQIAVVDLLSAYCEVMPAEVKSGRGVVLFGPAGTGKDHLMTSLIRRACWFGISVEWRNGMDLFSERRDAIDANRPERELLRDLVRPDVLAISDPLPPWGNLTEWQGEYLFRIVDARYRQRKPIWVTANFSGGKEAADRIGSQVLDRLKDGSLGLHCDWPSYRKAGS